ncbi:bifunctional 3-deoxy-7-phosphoheptulonate synthase/chorismate mutase [Ferrimonas aestuarii]|uniref:3-deoxy-7-phosphoheptulonate synthase n=1 Tax=Ferrimonas aestuarii TaxID=2569539 RepID=A0A4V5NWK1_9GAMM|nr:bifunctional 3-deoxy-7-phosphoheptulonate synthase/chorismate mutase [Ferrimonas aestuarii]TKB58438.1 3-deoxy-7-phosphoheptulonate synthase [Ferrimonas aestuarii]
MIFILKPHATEQDAKQLLDQIEAAGLKPLYMPGVERTVIGAIGDERVLNSLHLDFHPLVDEVKPILSSYKLVSRELYPIDTRVKIGNFAVGGEAFTVIAGPCAVESQQQLDGIADYLTQHKVAAIRGGAYKPRTSPYSFQGLGEEGLKILKATSERSGLPTVSEIVDANDAELMAQYVDCLQIGARNMQNFRLLEAVGKLQTPVLLKRGMSATIEELLLAAEYIVNAGNPNVILCERGIRTYETATRNTLDLNAVAYLKQKTHLPVLVDPSHGTGVRDLVIPLSRAAAAVGADGIIVETHTNPAQALSDGHQNLDPQQFDDLMSSMKPFVEAAGRSL